MGGSMMGGSMMGGSMMGGSMMGRAMPAVIPDQAFMDDPTKFMLEPRNCNNVVNRPSQDLPGSGPVNLFIGTMGIEADLFWKDQNGQETFYQTIPANSMNPGDHVQGTSPLHTWIVRDKSGNCIAGFVVEENQYMKSNSWNIMIGMPLDMVRQMKNGMGGMMMGGSMMGGTNSGMMRP